MISFIIQALFQIKIQPNMVGDLSRGWPEGTPFNS